MELRTKINHRINRLYRFLQNELFSDMSPGAFTELKQLSKSSKQDNGDDEDNFLLEIDDSTCPICYEKESFDREFVITTSCEHFFCYDCIRKHFKANGTTCPLCRNQVMGIAEDGIQYPMKEPTATQAKELYIAQKKNLQEKMSLLEKEKEELKTLRLELTHMREQMRQKVIDDEISDVSSSMENTHIIHLHEQHQRQPRMANRTVEHRSLPPDQYYTPGSAIISIINVIGGFIKHCNASKFYFLIIICISF